MNEEKERPAGNPPLGHRRFGKYVLLSSQESGTFAQLYKAHDSDKKRLVLLRILSPSVSENPAFQEYLDGLSKNRGRFLDDPGVLRLLEVGRAGKRFYFSYEYVEAESLENAQKKRRLPVDEALSILRQTVEGLRAFHSKRIIHGDVKPSNILIYKDASRRTMAKLAPTDLATGASEAMVSIYGSLVGTPKYLAPELIEGQPAEIRSDIFSLGVVAYEMFAGKAPFEAENPLAYMRANSERDPMPLALVDNTIPEEVSKVVARMMSRDPRKRYRSCQNILDDLDRVESRMAGERSETVPAGMDSAFAASPAQPAAPSKSPWKAAAIIAFTMCALLVAGIALLLIFKPGILISPTDRPIDPVSDDGQVRRDPPDRPVEPETIDRQFRQVNDDVDRILSVSGDFDRAYIRLGEFIEKHPGTFQATDAEERQAQILLQKADAFRRGGHFSDAVDTLTRLRERHSDRRAALEAISHLGDTLYEWGEASFAANRWREGVEHLERILSEIPGARAASRARESLPQRHIDWAAYLQQQADPEAELAVLDRLMDRYPESTAVQRATSRRRDTLLLVGRRMHGRADYEGAASIFGQLVELSRGTPIAAQAQEGHARSLAALSVQLLDNARPLDAVDRWKQLVAAHPDSEFVARQADMALVAEVAVRLRADADRGDAILDDSVLLARWAARLEEMGRGEDAKKYYQLVRDRLPDSMAISSANAALARFAYSDAEGLVAGGNLEAAIEAMREVAGRFPNTDSGRAAVEFVRRAAEAPEGTVFIPGGAFAMGMSDEKITRLAERYGIPEALLDLEFGAQTPEHTAEVRGFHLDINPVTNEQYLAFVRDRGHKAPQSPDWDENRVRPGRERHPVAGVSLADAKAYAQWAGKRLPTEQEWEKAARGTDGRLFPWGDSFDASRANIGARENRTTTPVGSYREGAGIYGNLDLIGNVWEWTSSPYLAYPGNATPIAGFDERRIVVRGGSWQDNEPYRMTAASRLPLAPETLSPRIGFRCAKDAE